MSQPPSPTGATGDQLVLGASNPVRDAALVSLNTDGVAVRSNRGVAGIDGTVSTAIGAMLAHRGGPLRCWVTSPSFTTPRAC